MTIIILNESVTAAKVAHGGVISILDISKAFETIPHRSIRPGFERKSIQRQMCSYIESMYRGCKTQIKGSDGIVDIELKRGVKQGDPLSPLLFNLAIDRLIEKLSIETRGIDIGESWASVLAFADDLVLLGRDKDEAKTQLRIVEEYLRKLGMALSATKCSTFEVVAKKKSWYVTDRCFNVGDDKVPAMEQNESLMNLGVKIGPWRRLLKGTEVPTIIKMIRNVRELKPYQKINIIQNYILPRYIFSLTNNRPAKGTLKMLDNRYVRS